MPSSIINDLATISRKLFILSAIYQLEKEGVEPRYNEIVARLLNIGEWMSPNTLSKYLKDLAKDNLIITKVVDEKRNYVAYSVAKSNESIEKLLTMYNTFLHHIDIAVRFVGILKEIIKNGKSIIPIIDLDIDKGFLALSSEYETLIRDKAKRYLKSSYSSTNKK